MNAYAFLLLALCLAVLLRRKHRRLTRRTEVQTWTQVHNSVIYH